MWHLHGPQQPTDTVAMLVPTQQIPKVHLPLSHTLQRLSQPRAAPWQPWSKCGGYLGVSTAIKTYRRYNNNNDGDNNSTFLCSEHRWVIVLVGIRP